MARETREDRIVRQMIPQLTEHFIELKNLAAGPSKESDVENWAQSLLKTVLGFTASGGYQVRTQETHGKMRFDIVVSSAAKPDQILFVAEIKRLGADLDKADFRSGKTQLQEYLKTLGDVRWGLLSNGYEWRLYDFKSDFISVQTADLRNEAHELDTSAKAIQDAAWDLLDFSAYYFESKNWEKLSTEAQALSPDSLARSILNIDVVKRIGKNLNGEHDYRASIDVLTDKLAELLEQGLNDLVGSWNEVMHTELQGYIRKQKKQAKKRKRVEASPGQVQANGPAQVEPVESGTAEASAIVSVTADASDKVPA